MIWPLIELDSRKRICVFDHLTSSCSYMLVELNLSNILNDDVNFIIEDYPEVHQNEATNELKSLLFGTLFLWARIWGCMNCISLSMFLFSSSFSFWLFCICFLFRVFTIVSMMFNFFNINSYYLSKKKRKFYYPRISWLLGCWEYFKVFQLYACVILHLLR